MAAGTAVRMNTAVPIHEACTTRAANGSVGTTGSSFGRRGALSSSPWVSLWYATAQASHGVEGFGQSSGQPVVGELVDGAPAGGGAEAIPPFGVVHQRGQRRGHRAHRSGPAH